MERELSVGQQKILFDRDATIVLYQEIITVAGADKCRCTSCKNFAAQRGKILPERFLHLMEELGTDPLKEWEVFDYDFDRNPNSPHLYGGWFLFVGELLEGVDKRLQSPEVSFAHWFTTSFPTGTLPTDIELCAVEFLAQIPWVLPTIPKRSPKHGTSSPDNLTGI